MAPPPERKKAKSRKGKKQQPDEGGGGGGGGPEKVAKEGDTPKTPKSKKKDRSKSKGPTKGGEKADGGADGVPATSVPSSARGVPTSSNLKQPPSTANPDDQALVVKNTPAKSLRYVGLEPEWNSEAVRNETLISDGFTCCIVFVMEESSGLSQYTHFLEQAVATGIRKNFASITASFISEKVRRYMTSAGLREPGKEDTSYMDRLDLWAEAIKYILLQFKVNAIAELEAKAKGAVITGARSKEMLNVFKKDPLNPLAVESFSAPNLPQTVAAEPPSSASKSKRKGRSKEGRDPSKESKPDDTGASKKKKGKGKGKGKKKGGGTDTEGEAEPKAKQKGRSKSKSKEGRDPSKESKPGDTDTEEAPKKKKGKGKKKKEEEGDGEPTEPKSKSKAKSKSKEGRDPSKESKPGDTDTEAPKKKGKGKKKGEGKGGRKGRSKSKEGRDPSTESTKGKKGKGKKKNVSGTGDAPPSTAGDINPAEDASASATKTFSKPTLLRKRGEFGVPIPDFVEDSPPSGPHNYFFLHGFYNADLLEQLEAIGVHIDSVLLLTAGIIDKRNFSALDIEQNITSTLQPHSILPDYARAMERHLAELKNKNPDQEPSQEQDQVLKFWTRLVEIINKADLSSTVHDIALMNLQLPSNPPQSVEQQGEYAARLFDEAVQRVYEMLVLTDWYNEYKLATLTREFRPIEPTLSTSLYDRLLNELPAECVTVPVIMECLIEQVVENERHVDENASDSDGTKVGHVDWDWPGCRIPGTNTIHEHKPPNPDSNQNTLLLPAPNYILSHDDASLRSCHLNPIFASNVASTHVLGSMLGLQDLLWNRNMPAYNKGLAIKLLGNLNHFMHFLPPGAIRHDEMFYILHLLMAAGVEVELQKQVELPAPPTEEAALEPGEKTGDEPESSKPEGSPFEELNLAETDARHTRTQYARRCKPKETAKGQEQAAKHPGTKLQKDHNYLVVEQGAKGKSEFILASRSNEGLEVKMLKEGDRLSSEESGEEFGPIDVPAYDYKAATIATDHIVETSAQFSAQGQKGQQPSGPPPNTAATLDDGGGDQDFKDAAGNRIIACEEEWFASITNDESVFQRLLECPALLTVNENGALNMDNWVKTYLHSQNEADTHTHTGGPHHRARGLAPILGPLDTWNYVERMEPVQLIQALHSAVDSYLCVDRMYCPFYDTLIFIFTNPVPESLKSDTESYARLNTLPGLQHFLEYSINEDHVLDWLLQLEKNKSVDVVDTVSVTTLMRIVPEDQWMLIPSIKYAILRAQKEQRKEARRLAKAAKRVDVGGDGDGDAKKLKSGLISDDEGVGVSTGVGKRKGKGKDKDKNANAGNVTDGEEDESLGQLKKLKKVASTRRPFTGEAGEFTGESRGGTALANRNHNHPNSPVPNVDDALDERLIVPLDGTPSFNFSDAIKQAKGMRAAVAAEQRKRGQKEASFVPPKFYCYDLGKRVLVAASDVYHLHPMDGTRISYEVSSIDPDYHCLQLTVKKHGHAAYFYPYYIPHDMDLNQESYVVCPYFHMVHANGTLYTFQDRRATAGDEPLHQTEAESKGLKPDTFSYDKNVIFTDNVQDFLQSKSTKDEAEDDRDSSKPPTAENPPDDLAVPSTGGAGEDEELGRVGSGRKKKTKNRSGGTEGGGPSSVEGKSSSKSKKGKGKKGAAKDKDKDKGKDKETGKSQDEMTVKDKEGGGGGGKKKKAKATEKPTKKGKRNKAAREKSDTEAKSEAEVTEEEEEELGEVQTPVSVMAEAPPPTVATPGATTDEEGGNEGEWTYSTAENTEAEEEERTHAPETEPELAIDPSLTELPEEVNWNDAVPLLEPMTHSFHITLPSGQHLTVEDVPGKPLRRHVKQTYLAKGSASSVIEKSRHITMQGTVVKFMLNQRVQVLTARGVTTTIKEVHALTPTFESADAPPAPAASLHAASHVRVRKGEVILPTGERWKIKRGRRIAKDPLFVYSSGVLPNGETFRRRQDGVVYLHRHDGTVITHYPDGTRFTMRMIEGRDRDRDGVEGLEDWELIGLKYMVEHPNYATVVTNTLSGNIHIKISQGEWVRVFADGSVKIGTSNEFKLDVDKFRATITNPSCEPGDKNIPNLVTVKLWHSHEKFKLTPSEEQKAEASVEPEPTAPKGVEPEGEDTASQKPKQRSKSKGRKEAKASTSSTTTKTTRAKRAQRPKPKKSGKIKAGNRKSVTSIKTTVPEPVEPAESVRSEGEEEEEYDAVPQTQAQASPEAAAAHVHENFDVANFLEFTDMWTLCKAIDCFDNRFTVDIFGDTVVDKCDRLLEKQSNAAKDQIAVTISKQFDVPRQFVSGILKSTSSEQLSTLVKRKAALANMQQAEACSKLANSRVFVVKRDLSGFEYLTRAQVEKLVQGAKSRSMSGAVVLKDTVHMQGGSKREMIRIMEPVVSGHGLWKSNYREPVFRPRYLSTKSLRVARPEDLRWFSYIVTTAHARRPKFFLTPRQDYEKRKKEGPRQQPQPAKKIPQKPTAEKQPQQQSLEGVANVPEKGAEPVTKADEKEEAELPTAELAPEGEGTATEKQKAQSRPKGRKGRHPSAADTINTQASDQTTKGRKLKRRQSVGGKKARSRKGKSKSRLNIEASSSLNDALDKGKSEGEETAEAGGGGRAKSVGKAPEAEAGGEAEGHGPSTNLEDAEIPDYPSEPPHDVLGLYGIDDEHIAEVRAQFHADPEPSRHAIVLHNIMEIPMIDENMTRALLAASLSYADTIENQRRMYETETIDEQGRRIRDDPRVAAQKEEQRLIKQRLLEQNLDQMHLLQQEEGKLLQFHL